MCKANNINNGRNKSDIKCKQAQKDQEGTSSVDGM